MPNPPRLLSLDGVTRSIREWSAITGVPFGTIVARIERFGWEPAKAVHTPADRRFRGGGRPPGKAPRNCPKLKEHASGQAFVRWKAGDKDHFRYFGRWGTDAANRAYSRFCAEWVVGQADAAAPRRPGEVVYVGELVARYLAWADRTYVKHGKRTSETHCLRVALRPLNELYGEEPADGFKTSHLRAVRAELVAKGYVRKSVNGHIARVIRCFAWGAANDDLVPAGVVERLRLVESVAPGRAAEPDPEPVPPAPLADVIAVLRGPHLHARPERRRVLRAMVWLQLRTGMRPGEVCGMTADQLERRGRGLRYVARVANKNLHRGKPRVVWLGRRAQRLLAPFLGQATGNEAVFRFPPRGETGTKWVAVSREAYARFVAEACERAGVPPWTPHQLRHTYATRLADRYEDDAAVGRALGDTPEVARQVYVADPGEAVARRIAREVG